MTVLVPYVIDALATDADVLRRMADYLGQRSSGVLLDAHLKVSAPGGMNVAVAAGQALVRGSENATTQGAYHVTNDASVSLSIAAADATNARWDLVILKVRDLAYSGASKDAVLTVVTGTPAASPADPSLSSHPNNITLARVVVPANAASIVSGNITDKRPFLQAVSAPVVKALGTAVNGSAPAVGPTTFLWQGGTASGITTAGGQITITFPSVFPSGIVALHATVGDNANALSSVQIIHSTITTSGFNVSCLAGTTPINAAAVRVSWSAVGW